LNCIGHLYSMLLDKFNMNDLGADYLYSGSNPVSFMLPNGLKEITDYEAWKTSENRTERHPLLTAAQFLAGLEKHPQLNFLNLSLTDLTSELIGKLKQDATCVLLLHTTNEHAMPELRRAFFSLLEHKIA